MSPKLKENSPKLYAMLVDNLAFAKMKSGENFNCEKLFLEAFMIRDSLEITSGIVMGTIHLGEFYVQRGDTVKDCFILKKGTKKPEKLKALMILKML